ncbi:hypothetical protein Tco_0854961 [Tanacetum coccineum]
MSWFSRCSWCGGPFNGGNCMHCTNVSFGDEPVYDSNSYNQTPDFSNSPSQPQTSSLDQWHCFHCKYPLERGEHCQQCTCKWCRYALSEGFCSFYPSRDENSSIDAPNPNSFNDPLNDFNHPPPPQNESYSCELCGNDSHYGYDCPPQFPLPLNIQENPDWQKIYELIQMMQSSSEKLLQQEQAASITQSPFQKMSIQDMEDLKQHYLDEMLSLSNQIQIEDYQNEKIDIRFRRECESTTDELNADPKEDIRLIEKLLNDDSSPHSSEEINSEISDAIIESFSPSLIPVEDSDSLMEEIDIFLASSNSIPSGIKNDDYDSEGDILFLKELLNEDLLSRLEYETFHVDRYNVLSSLRPPEKPLDDDEIYFNIEPDSGDVTTKVVDDIYDNSIRELYIQVPNVLHTHPTLYPVFDTLLPFSSENEDKVFNPRILISKEEISPHLLSHRDCSDYKDSRAPGFVHRPLDL